LDDFSNELNELEQGIKSAMENDILKQTADGLKDIKSDIK
jgi:hypothetical protein